MPQRHPRANNKKAPLNICKVSASSASSIFSIDTEVLSNVSSPNEGPGSANQHAALEDRNDSSHNSEQLFEIVLEQGILVPPKLKQPYNVSELELLSKQAEDTKTNNLWSLACSIVQQSFETTDSLKGATMPSKERFQIYYNLMEDCLRNYGDTGHGNCLLSHFNRASVEGKVDWPPAIVTKWNQILDRCRQGLQKWLGTNKCVLNATEIKKMSVELQIRTYVGSIIDDQISETERAANTHVNKHWPNVFKSGESPAALLQMIRRWYCENIEMPRRVNNNLKSWLSRMRDDKRPNGYPDNKVPDGAIDEQRRKIMLTMPFQINWFPSFWLVWYCYGPPACNGKQEFQRTEMKHLAKVKAAPRAVSQEELIVQLGNASKYVRRTMANKKQKLLEDDGDLETLTTSASTVRQSTVLHKVDFVRSDAAVAMTAQDHLDRAIKASAEAIALVQKMKDQGIAGLEDDFENSQLELLRLLVSDQYI